MLEFYEEGGPPCSLPATKGRFLWLLRSRVGCKRTTDPSAIQRGRAAHASSQVWPGSWCLFLSSFSSKGQAPGQGLESLGVTRKGLEWFFLFCFK